MNPTEFSYESDGVTYVFRHPSAKDIVQIDVNALHIRGGETAGLGLGYTYSQTIAMLNHLCKSPKGADGKAIDFGDLPDYAVDEIGQKVAEWLNSFRKPTGTESGSVDQSAQ